MKSAVPLILAVLLGGPGPVRAGAAEKSEPHVVDRAALRMQEQSIAKLRRLVHEAAGTRSEPDLLSRLADLELERSGITFRISEGHANTGEGRIHRASLQAAVRTLSRLIALSPDGSLAPAAYFKRGKAASELGEDLSALRDLSLVVSKFPDFEWRDSAEMALGDLQRKREKHAEALTHYRRVEEMPESPHHPFALHQGAWSRYLLGEIPSALETLGKECAIWFRKLDAKTAGPYPEKASSRAFLEVALGDAAFFSFEALNRKLPGASIEGSLRTLRELDRDGQHLGLMVLKLARMLKGYALGPELEALKTLLMHRHPSLPETSEVAILFYQLQLERRAWNRIPDIASELPKLRQPGIRSRLEPVIRESLSALHALVTRNKDSSARMELVKPLITVTDSLNGLLGSGNPTVLSAQYALAETLFDLGEYREAARRYASLETPAGQHPAPTRHSLIERRLSAQFRAWEKEGRLPGPFKVVKLASPSMVLNETHRAELSKWAEEALQTTPLPSGFEIEALKILYQLSQTHAERFAVLERLEQFALARPGTPEGTSATGIVLDTLSDSGEWDLLAASARRLGSWNIAENAELKALLASSEDAESLNRARTCLARATLPSVRRECSIAEARALIRTGDRKEAEARLSQLLLNHPEEPRVQAMLLTRADLLMKSGRIEEAGRDLEAYQKMTRFRDTEMTLRLLQHHWFSGNWTHLQSLLTDPLACANEFRKSLCAPFEAARALMEGRDAKTPYLALYRNTLRAPENARALWCLMALTRPRTLAFQDRLVLLQRLGKSWNALPPNLQLHFLPLLRERAGDAMESIRLTAPGIAPLRPDSAAILRRVELVREIEGAFGSLLVLPSIGLKTRGVEELVRIHQTLLDGLKQMQVPPGELTPLQEKIANLQQTLRQLSALRYELRRDGDVPPLPELLLSSEFTSALPPEFRDPWARSAQRGRGDALLQVASILDSDLLRGAALLVLGSPSEAAPLIQEAPESSAKRILQKSLLPGGPK
jgi:tetratricopeptide (TPR) repeat protein